MAHGPVDLDEDLAEVEPAAAGEDSGRPAGRGPRTPSWPERTPAWVRSPLGALVAAVLAAALVGAAGVQQVRAQVESARALDRDLALVQVAEPSIVFDGTVVPGAVDGVRRMDLQLSLLNGGEQPVEVGVAGLSTEQVALDLPPAVALEPGAGQLVVVPAEVDCAAVSPSSREGAGGAAASWVDLVVVADGQRHEQRRVVRGDLTEQLFWTCVQSWGGGSTSASFAATEDGRQRVTLTNSGPQETRADVAADPALGLSSDADLPVTVPARGSVTVVLGLSPDCRLVDDGLGRRLDVVEVLGDPADEDLLVVSDQVLTAAWVARQVALTCG